MIASAPQPQPSPHRSPAVPPELPAELVRHYAGPWSDLVRLAWRAAAATGQLLLAGQGGTLQVSTKSTATDVVTQMDTAAESALAATILAARPQDAWVGEEHGTRSGTSGLSWIVDPLDGTVNYLYGRAAWAVSVAAEAEGEVVAGVVIAPALHEGFCAVRGAGAHHVGGAGAPGGQAIRTLAVNTPAHLAQALVGTGFGYASGRRAAQGRIVSAVLPQVRDIRRAGAAALDLCDLAAGRLDGYYERGLNPWDHAAAALVAAEAGAIVGGLPDATAWGTAGVELAWAIWPGLAEQFRDVLLAAGADRD